MDVMTRRFRIKTKDNTIEREGRGDPAVFLCFHSFMSFMKEELVVLVDEENREIGTAKKAEVHGASTPLHRAFSSFLFRQNGDVLLQQRHHTKKTWPLVWSNSCCGHLAPGETVLQAAKRRIAFELGLEVTNLVVAALYRYCFTRDGVMENEICPIVIGTTAEEPHPHPEEIEAIRWMPWKDFLEEIKDHPSDWSEWCVEEAFILNDTPIFLKTIPQ